MIFANLFAITSTPQHIQDVKEMVLSLLEDEQLEVLFIVLCMKSTEIVTIQMKASEQCFSVMRFIMLYKVILTFESVCEILWCDHSNESYGTVLSFGTLYYALQGGSNFWVCGWNLKVWPVKWKILNNTFLCGWNPAVALSNHAAIYNIDQPEYNFWVSPSVETR